MSLRGIFDGGGLRKQNGHYQSSGKQQWQRSGVYWKGPRRGWGQSGLSRGITINRAIKDTQLYQMQLFATEFEGGDSVQVLYGNWDNGMQYPGYTNTTGQYGIMVGMSEDDFRWRDYEGPVVDYTGEIITDESKWIVDSKYQWMLPSGIPPRQYNYITGTWPPDGENWSESTVLHLWECEWTQNPETGLYESGAPIRDTGITLQLIQTRRFTDPYSGRNIFVGAWYGSNLRAEDIIWSLKANGVSGFKTFKFQFRESIYDMWVTKWQVWKYKFSDIIV